MSEKAVEFLFKLKKKQLYPYQRAFLKSLSKKKIVNKSRQVGFSYLLADELLTRALKGHTVIIVSPSERQSKHVLDYAYATIQALRAKKVEVTTLEETRTCIRFRDGGEFWSLPNSPSTIRGIRADCVCFDEAAHFLHGTDTECWEAVLPSISRGGEVWLISTPFGEAGLFYEVWGDVDGKGAGFERFTVNHSECLDLDITPIRASMDALSFAQEYENRFLGSVGTMFPYSLLRASIGTTQYTQGKETYMGIDIGRRSDFTAIAIIQKTGEGYGVVHFELLREMKFSAQRERISYLAKTFRPASVHIDETGIGMQISEELGEELGDIVKPVTFTNENKGEMITETKRLLEMKHLTLIDDSALINALNMVKRTQAGNSVKYESDRTDEFGHADAAWALALAVYATIQDFAPFTVPEPLRL